MCTRDQTNKDQQKGWTFVFHDFTTQVVFVRFFEVFCYHLSFVYVPEK